MKLLDAISCFSFLILFSVGVSAQQSIKHDLTIDIPEVALLALQSNNNDDINFRTIQPDVAGQEIQITEDQQSELWVNYSSIVKASHRRKITATVVGEIPSGLILKVMASENRGDGQGKLGEPLSWVVLENSPVDVISNIGSCYTGRGTQNGHLLTYKIELNEQSDQYAYVAQSETSLQILYTLTDDN